MRRRLDRPNVLARRVAAALVLAATAGPASAEALILEVAGPAPFSVSQVLPTGARVKLPAGASLKVLRDDSRQLIVRGPFDGPLPGAAKSRPGLLASLRNLFDIQSLMRAVVLRSPESRLTDPRLLDATSGGDKCAFAGSPPRLWHPPPSSATSLQLARIDGSETTASWPREQSIRAWPSPIEIVDQGTYLLQIGSNTPVNFRLHVAPRAFEDAAQELEWLAHSRCVAQAEAFLASVETQEIAGAVDAEGAR